MTELDFEPKRILKHKNHVTLNEGNRYDAEVQHLEKREDEFVELKKNEAAKKYGSKKLVRDLDFKSRDGLQVEESGLEQTPEWFPQVLPTIKWESYRTLLYEIDHLWMNMFFVRELYGEEREGREQILEMTKAENGLGLDVVAELEYSPKYESTEYEDNEVNGLIKVEIIEEEKENSEGEEGKEFDLDVDYKQSFWEDGSNPLASGLREIMTGIALKHDHTGEQLHLKIDELAPVKSPEVHGRTFVVQILNKDFAVKFNEAGALESGISPWVLEMLSWDGCPLNVEEIEVTN